MSESAPSSLRLVLSADRNYLPGISVSLCSALAFLPRTTTPRITIIHDGFCAADKDCLSRLALRMHDSATCTFTAVDKLPSGLPSAPGLHPLAYARLLAPDLVDDETFVYIDSDLLVLRDLSVLTGSISADAIAAAPYCGRLGDDCPWLEPERMSPDDPYFCSGVLAVRNTAWRESEIGPRAIALAVSEPEKCHNYDQTVLNYLLHGRVTILDESWSWNHWQFAAAPTQSPLVIHYLSAGKPWRAPSMDGVAGLWLKAFECLCGGDWPGLLLRLNARAYLQTMTVATGACIPKLLPPQLAKRFSWQAKRAREDRSAAMKTRVADCMARLHAALACTR